MSTHIIPVRSGTDAYKMAVILDGKNYGFLLRYNLRDSYWYLDISRETVTLIAGVKLVHTEDLLVQFKHIEDIPKGQLEIYDQSGLYRDPGAEEFGEAVIMRYHDAV